MFVSTAAGCTKKLVAKNWIECEYNTEALNLGTRLSRKHEVVAKAWIKHKVVTKAYVL